MRLMISYPTSGMHCAAFSYSKDNMVGYMLTANPVPDLQFQVGLSQGSNWIENREDIAERARDKGFTHLCFLDDDMVFAPDVLVSMIGHIKSGCDIVLTNYLVKEWPPKTFSTIGLDGERVITRRNSTGIMEVLAGGFGVSIMTTDLFRKVPQPWYLPNWNQHTGYGTEDTAFFHRCREAGFRLWVDQDASKKVAHNGQFQWSWQHYEKYGPESEVAV